MHFPSDIDERRELMGGRGVACVLLICGALLGTGCESKSPLVTVRGTVTLDGQPLESGAIQFHPTVGQLATGDIGPGGEFLLSTQSPGDGVLPGTYRVTVVAYRPDATEPGPDALLVPLRYTRAGSSDIEVTVFPGATAPVKIELVSADPATAEAGADSSQATPSGDDPGAATAESASGPNTGDTSRAPSESR